MYSLRLSLVVVVVALAAVNASNRGFLLTAPKRLLAGSIEMICISLHNMTGPADVSLELLHKSSPEKISSTQHRMTRDSECIEFPVYPTLEAGGRLKLEVKFDEMFNYSIYSVQEVVIQQNPLIVLIQTDKPVYKPGQLVQFRLLTLSHDLKPVILPLEKVWLESPSEVRLAQWSNLTTQNGLVQLDFQLSQEPILGMWKIKVARNNSEEEVKTFEVREYVLPRFEVTITPPDFVLADSNELTWKICAKYSYGQPVKGHAHIDVKPKYSEWIPVCDPNAPTTKAYTGQVRWSWQGSRCIDPPMGVRAIMPLDGCVLFNATGMGLEIDKLSQHNDPIQTVVMSAVVSEANTDIKRNATSVSTIRHDPLSIEFLPHTARYFKPYLPYLGKLRVLYPNSVPAEGKLISLCVRSRGDARQFFDPEPIGCRNFTTDSQGFVHFSLPPQNKNISLSLTATAVEYDTLFYSPDIRWHVKMNQPVAYFEVESWYSPSDSFVEVSDDGIRIPRCNYHHMFRVQFTKHKNSPTPTFYYLVKARGDLVLFNRVNLAAIPRRTETNNTIPMRVTSAEAQDTAPSKDTPQVVDEFGIKLMISPKMSPISQLLVYYVREDGETVAATHTLHIKQCFPNKVSTAWQQERQFPGAPAVFHLAAAPYSLCGITAVDKSTSFLVSNDPSNTDIVFKRLKVFQIDEHSAPQNPDAWNYCDNSVQNEYVRRRRSLHPRFFMPPLISDAARAFEDFGVIVMTDLTLNTKPCIPTPIYEYNFPMMRSGKALSVEGDEMDDLELQAVDSDALLGLSVPVKGYSGDYTPSPTQAAVEIRSFFPETWLWELVDTGKNGRAKLRRELPHTVTDWIGSAVCVSPQQGLGISSPTQITAFQPFFVELVLPYAVKRGEVMQLKVALYSFLSNKIPVRLTFEQSLGIEMLSEESSVSSCVEQHANWVHHFRIRATELGEVNLTVSAEVDASFPSPCGPETIISRRDVLIKPLLVKPEGFPVEVTKSALICAKNDDSAEDKAIIWDLHLPMDVVESSARAELNVVSDLMGPALQNLGSLVQLPMGCGEQNMILFVPNLHVVNYLQATHQPNPVLQAEAIKNMEKGYQRELNYRHGDGSYSAFGKSDKEGSMWLTAFVVKTFAQARSHIFVDEKDLDISLKWISKYQLENGCFPVVGQVFHHDLRGGLSDDKMTAALTAYILISLLETNLSLPHSLVENAKYCLLGDRGDNIYSKALITYALTLLGDQEIAQDHMQQLIELATVEQEMMSWQKSGSESRALNVEMTAYAILALVKLGGEQNLVTANKAVRWISQHRNANGGFVSTQDTVVALEALSKYSASLPSESIDLNILVTANSVDHLYHIGQHDRLLLKRQSLTVLPSHIEVIAHGSGCALVQSWLRYNVHTPSGDDALELKTKVLPIVSKDRCSRQNLEFCVRYKPKGETSNMAVLEVSMASGYVPVKESLQPHDNSIYIKRWEIQDDQVNFYFDSLSNDQFCLKFMVEQGTDVENPLPANVRLYDYYQPELVLSKSYQIATKCDIELLPQPLPSSTEQLNNTSVISENAAGGLALESTLQVSPSAPNAIQEEPEDSNSNHNNISRSSKPRMRRRKQKGQATTTESYSTPPPDILPETLPNAVDDLFTMPSEVDIRDTISSLPPVQETTQLSLDNLEDLVDDPLQLVSSDNSMATTSLNQQFVDVDHDLEFPDGVEGPSPVYVLPDGNTTNNLAPDTGNCPVCWDGFLSDFSPIYCNATAVYKAITRKTDTLRLLLDLTPSKNVVRLRKVMKLELPSPCLCQHLVNENSTVLLVLEHSLEGHNELLLDRSANIWEVPSQQGPPEQVRLAKSQCQQS